MIDLPDLHPDDLAARVAFRDRMRQLRRDTCSWTDMYSRCLAAGLDERYFEGCERTTQWGVQKAARWARLFDHRFMPALAGLTLPEDDDLEAALLEAATPFGAQDEDDLHMRRLVNDLARIRFHRALSTRAFARLAKAGERSVLVWESKPTACLVKSLQRYARALGGVLELRLEPVAAAAAS